ITVPTRDDRKEVIAGEVVCALCAYLGIAAIATSGEVEQ
ncbi:MAG: shikimate kinase, partial [Mesorhizobium sp.]